MSFPYGRLCGTAPDAVDAVKFETLNLGVNDAPCNHVYALKPF